jgi:hypothetical protein
MLLKSKRVGDSINNAAQPNTFIQPRISYPADISPSLRR